MIIFITLLHEVRERSKRRGAARASRTSVRQLDMNELKNKGKKILFIFMN